MKKNRKKSQTSVKSHKLVIKSQKKGQTIVKKTQTCEKSDKKLQTGGLNRRSHSQYPKQIFCESQYPVILFSRIPYPVSFFVQLQEIILISEILAFLINVKKVYIITLYTIMHSIEHDFTLYNVSAITYLYSIYVTTSGINNYIP